GIKVSGFIGKISFTKPTRAYQTLIVNGRYVVDNTVGSAIANAYGGYLMKRQYPFYVLNLDIPTQSVDVNVHPRKAEVRFSNNQIIYAAVYSTVTKVLDGSSAALEIIKEDGSQFSYKEEGRGEIIQPITYQTEEDNNATSSADVFAEKSDKKQAIKQLSDKNTFGYDYAKRGSGYASSSSTLVFNDSGYLGEMQQDKEQGVDVFAENKKYIEKLEREKQLKELAYKQQEIEVEVPMVYVGQLFNTYLIFQMGSDMFLIDQHAAHERLIYDELCEKAQNSDLGSLPLLLPYTFNVAREDFNCIYTRMDQFRSMGFDITNVGDSSFKISAIPCDLSEINLKEFFDDILYDDSFKNETITLTLREKLMQKACKHAVKAGDKLTSKDIDSLMAKLKGNFGLRCPHGRPVAVKVTKQEIEKWFKRIV
ncbi:MAG: hypothetical protein IJW13_01770, partial [Clostridia bacterium]|nr:hypothetical protein [Clostridia bacterium]